MQECDKVLASITSGFNSQLYQDSLEDGSWDSSPVNRIWANEAESQVDAAIATLDLQQQLGQDEETVELARAVAISQGRIVAGCFNRAYPVNADTH
jgi:hypothetical protein